MHDTRDDVLVTLSNEGKAQYRLTPTGESDTNGNPAAACLVFDSANRGIYTGGAVINLARDLGWTDASAYILYDDTDVESAEDYLNTLTPNNYQFGFSDGDFFLANDAWWEIASE